MHNTPETHFTLEERNSYLNYPKAEAYGFKEEYIQLVKFHSFTETFSFPVHFFLLFLVLFCLPLEPFCQPFLHWLLFIYLFIIRPGFELRASVLVKQELYHFSHTSGPLYFGRDGGLTKHSRMALNGKPPNLRLPNLARITSVSHWHPAALVIFEMGYCFFPRGLDHDLPVYASQCSWDNRCIA
jgi:hypothetical protein